MMPAVNPKFPHLTVAYFLNLLDIDECDTNNRGCDHNCVNTPGSSVCTCNSGYFLNVDGKSCEGTRELKQRQRRPQRERHLKI